MACIFQRKRGGPYYVAYFSSPGVRRYVKGSHDKAATKALGRKLETDAMLRRKGVVDTRAERYAVEAARPVSEHMTDFESTLTARGTTAKHVTSTVSLSGRLLAVCEGVAVKDLRAETVKLALTRLRIADLTPSAVQQALARLRADGLSLDTLNHYVRAVRQFSRWLWHDGRTSTEILAAVRGFNAATDRRHVRRALPDDELVRLIRAAAAGPVVFDMAGPDRSMLYTLATGTGFRASELASLTTESFALDAVPPTVAVAAGYSKRRRADVQPIPRGLAETLRPWLATKAPSVPVFNVPDLKEWTAKMMRADLAAAGIAYNTPEGIADFHSLRHGYVTRLVMSGMNIKLVQHLARHSTPALTLGRYAHVEMADAGLALDALPVLDAQRTTLGTTLVLQDDARRLLPSGPHELDNRAEAGVLCVGVADTCRDSSENGENLERWLSGRKRRIANPLSWR